TVRWEGAIRGRDSNVVTGRRRRRCRRGCRRGRRIRDEVARQRKVVVTEVAAALIGLGGKADRDQSAVRLQSDGRDVVFVPVNLCDDLTAVVCAEGRVEAAVWIEACQRKGTRLREA